MDGDAFSASLRTSDGRVAIEQAGAETALRQYGPRWLQNNAHSGAPTKSVDLLRRAAPDAPHDSHLIVEPLPSGSLRSHLVARLGIGKIEIHYSDTVVRKAFGASGAPPTLALSSKCQRIAPHILQRFSIGLLPGRRCGLSPYRSGLLRRC
jgi:hypothetical protein